MYICVNYLWVRLNCKTYGNKRENHVYMEFYVKFCLFIILYEGPR